MPIRVGHEVGGDALAAAAFGGGQGQARAALSAGRAAAGQRAAELRDQRERERLLSLGLVAPSEQAQAATAAMGQNYALQQQSAEAAQERGLEGFERSFTAQQRMKAEQYATAEANAMQDPAFSAADKEEIKFKFAQLRAGLQPVARPKAPTPAEIFQRNTFTDPKTGNVYALDEKGTISQRPIHERPEREPTWQDKLKAREIAMKMATSAEGGVNTTQANEIYAELIGQAQGAPGAAVGAGTPGGLSDLVDRDRYLGPNGEMLTKPGAENKFQTLPYRPGVEGPLKFQTMEDRGVGAAVQAGPSAAAPAGALPAAPDAIGEATKRLADARAKARGVETEDVKAAKEALGKARKAAEDELAHGVADTDTPEASASPDMTTRATRTPVCGDTRCDHTRTPDSVRWFGGHGSKSRLAPLASRRSSISVLIWGFDLPDPGHSMPNARWT